MPRNPRQTASAAVAAAPRAAAWQACVTPNWLVHINESYYRAKPTSMLTRATTSQRCSIWRLPTYLLLKKFAPNNYASGCNHLPQHTLTQPEIANDSRSNPEALGCKQASGRIEMHAHQIACLNVRTLSEDLDDEILKPMIFKADRLRLTAAEKSAECTTPKARLRPGLCAKFWKRL